MLRLKPIGTSKGSFPVYLSPFLMERRFWHQEHLALGLQLPALACCHKRHISCCDTDEYIIVVTGYCKEINFKSLNIEAQIWDTPKMERLHADEVTGSDIHTNEGYHAFGRRIEVDGENQDSGDSITYLNLYKLYSRTTGKRHL
ncbi:unnamed protein product [Leptosia nina]|uniref:Uncharacterized protein n=1 Tax=Leptosia nina TaxID=320188 RepID=A0AAV1JAT7_9NEOP